MIRCIGEGLKELSADLRVWRYLRNSYQILSSFGHIKWLNNPNVILSYCVVQSNQGCIRATCCFIRFVAFWSRRGVPG